MVAVEVEATDEESSEVEVKEVLKPKLRWNQGMGGWCMSDNGKRYWRTE